jgi:hypothetical protein
VKTQNQQHRSEILALAQRLSDKHGPWAYRFHVIHSLGSSGLYDLVTEPSDWLMDRVVCWVRCPDAEYLRSLADNGNAFLRTLCEAEDGS